MTKPITQYIAFNCVAFIKYRQKVLVGSIPDRLKAINIDVAKAFGVEIIEQETSIDHTLFSLSKFVNGLKSASARLIFREFPEIKKRLRKGVFLESILFSCFNRAGNA